MTELEAAVCIVLAVYCVGGLHGLWLAWTQPTRMAAWAHRAAAVQAWILEMEAKGGRVCDHCGGSHCGQSAATSSAPVFTGSASSTVAAISKG